MTDYPSPEQWLTGLEGQPVAIYTGAPSKLASLAQVTRLTATQILVGHQRFWRKDGMQVGAKYSGSRLLPVDHRDVRRALQVAAFGETRNRMEDLFKRSLGVDRQPQDAVKALREARGAIDQALATYARLWDSQADGELPGGADDLLDEAAARAAVRAYNCAVAEQLGHGTDSPTAWGPDGDEALLSNRAYRAGLIAHERVVLEQAAARVCGRMDPPRLGGMAYWHGLNDAARLVERKPLDD